MITIDLLDFIGLILAGSSYYIGFTCALFFPERVEDWTVPLSTTTMITAVSGLGLISINHLLRFAGI